MRANSRIVLLFGLAVGARYPLHAQEGWTFQNLESALREASALGGLSAAEKASLKESESLVGGLHDRYRRTFGERADTPVEIKEKLPPGFLDSMKANTEALRNLKSEPGTRLPVVAEVHDDLALKKNFAENALGIGGGFQAIVKTTVETMRDGKKVDGLWVRCNPRRYGVTADPLFVFNSASSPTTSNLPPGLFVMWVESSDHKVLASQPVEIGANGGSETIRFALP